LLNKIDQVQKSKLLPQIQKLQEMGFNHQIPCSALEHKSLEPLLKESSGYLPEQDFFYPVHQHVTYSKDFLIREVVREKIMRYTGQEVPYYCYVVCELEEMKNQHLHLHVRIEVPNDRYKMILLGTGGQHMKKIGEASRRTLETLLEVKIFLKLWIKVTDGPNALEKEQKQSSMFGWNS
jgi:GTP-binding protein Era